MEGKCEPGGAYRRDPEINEAVRAVIAADKRFALVETAKQDPRVVQVFDETRVTRAPAYRARPS